MESNIYLWDEPRDQGEMLVGGDPKHQRHSGQDVVGDKHDASKVGNVQVDSAIKWCAYNYTT